MQICLYPLLQVPFRLLVIPVLFSNAVNYATKQDYSAALLYIILSIIVTIIYRLSEGVNQRTFYDLYNSLYNYYNSRGIDKTNDNSIFSLSRFTLGQYTNMLTTDVDVISAFFANGVIRVVQLLEFVVIYAYFFALDVWLFVFALAVSIVALHIVIEHTVGIQTTADFLPALVSARRTFFRAIYHAP